MRQTPTQTRLDQLMDARRVELHMTWRQVAEAAGLSLAGLSAIRRGLRRPTTLTKRRIEDALRWAPGSINAILDGGEPVEADAEKTSERTPRQKSRARARRVRELQEEIQRRIDELQEQLDELRRMTEDEDTRGEDEDYRRAIG